jgi:hypothetical protein
MFAAVYGKETTPAAKRTDPGLIQKMEKASLASGIDIPTVS